MTKMPTIARTVRFGFLSLWAAICLFPIYWVAITSFKSNDAIAGHSTYLPFIDFTPQLDAWRFILLDYNENLLARYANSAVIGVCSTFLAVTAATLLLYGVTRFHSTSWWQAKISNHIIVAALCTRIIPPVVLVVPIYVMAYHAGLLDTWTLLIIVHAAANLPVAVWLLRPVLGSRAGDPEEAATLEGASHLMILRQIVVPMAAGSLAIVAFLVFLLSWNEYLFAISLATDKAMTLTPWMVGQMSMKEAQASAEGEEWSRFSAATVMMVIPLLACTGAVQRMLGRTALWRS